MNVIEYTKALKLGQKAYRTSILHGEYPYLPALDEILACEEIQTEAYLGLVDIPMEQIVGTKTAGRKNSFAWNFMPIMSEHSEFAQKWANLYAYQTETGVNDPIVAYEYMNKFYVLEGNKRVSVFKYLKSPSIEGIVTRIIPKKNDTLENKIYYEFMEFYKKTEINYLWFSREGCFDQLLRAVGKDKDEIWTLEEKKNFKSVYTIFQKLYEEKGGKKLPITTADALLFYLSLYPYAEYEDKSSSEKKAELDRIWKELSLLHQSPMEALVMQPSEEPELSSVSVNTLTKMLKLTSSKQLKVAFIHDRPAQISSWTYAHELGRTHLEQVFGEEIATSSYIVSEQDNNADGYSDNDSKHDISQILEEAIEDGNHIIFTTNQKFLAASLKTALEHPEVKILNCSVNQPYSALRTYYGRMYEVKFLCGMLAGAMCENDKIAYQADYPIYGSVANINAFALGVQMTNPRAKVYLHWSLQENADFQELLKREAISLISANDMIRPVSEERRFGLYLEKDGTYAKLATPIWDWGKFYEKMIRDMLQGNWNKTSDSKEKKALNYWWGISGNIIDLITSNNLPAGVKTLTEIMKKEIYTEQFHPFSGKIRLQDGSVIGKNDGCLSPEEIITMEWLVENVIGEIPPLESFTKEARTMAVMQKNLSMDVER